MFVRRITAMAALAAGLAAEAVAAEPTVKVTPVNPAVAAPASETPANAPAVPSGPAGKVEIKETIYDAGSIERGADLSHSFEIKNVGPGDLTVEAKPG